MKNQLLPFWVLIVVSSSAVGQTDGDILFAPDVLHQIRIESDQPNFFDQLIGVWDNGVSDIPYLSAGVRIDGQLGDSVGVRIKGGISAFDPKRPLKLDFNAFVPGQSYDGVKKLNLQNANFDLSLQREAIVYQMMRLAGVKAPRSGFAEVYVNDVLQGVYIMVEQVDKNFLRNYFASDEGVLYKNKTCVVEVDAGENTLFYYQQMLDVVNGTPNAMLPEVLDTVLATDALLRYFFMEVFVNAVDNPIQVDCNYYLYHEPKSDLVYWIPWDFNLALYPGANYPLLFNNGQNALFNKILQNPVYENRYLDLACQLLNGPFNANYLLTQVDKNANLIRAAAQNDPYYSLDTNAFDQQANNMKSLISARINALQADLTTSGVSCSQGGSGLNYHDVVINEFVASADSLGGNSDPAGGFPDWVELHNNTSETVSLQGYFLSNDADFLKHWAFPDTAEISPGGYLIIWADRDVDEEGLHADFKLDKDGGAIYLVQENFTLLDSVVYGMQFTNQASARLPNGTGDFQLNPPTLGLNNQSLQAVSGTLNELQIQVYPNPSIESVNVIFNGGASTDWRLAVYNALGQCVFRQAQQQPFVQIDLQNWAPGIYLMEANQGHQRYLQRLQVMR